MWIAVLTLVVLSLLVGRVSRWSMETHTERLLWSWRSVGCGKNPETVSVALVRVGRMTELPHPVSDAPVNVMGVGSVVKSGGNGSLWAVVERSVVMMNTIKNKTTSLVFFGVSNTI